MATLCENLDSISKRYGDARNSVTAGIDTRSVTRFISDMASSISPEPDQRGLNVSRTVIYVGQDAAGHWLVQDSAKRLEGRFVSQGAALSYARAEREIYHAEVEIASIPMVPLIPFAPVAAHECALPRAA